MSLYPKVFHFSFYVEVTNRMYAADLTCRFKKLVHYKIPIPITNYKDNCKVTYNQCTVFQLQSKARNLCCVPEEAVSPPPQFLVSAL